ncbi:Transcription repressor OFP13 [Linum grandiflorum]
MLDRDSSKYQLESEPGSAPGPTEPDSSFSPNSSAVAGDVAQDPAVESVIRGAKSERLFFSPGETSSSLLQDSEKGKIGCGRGEAGDTLFSIKEAVAVALDSKDPFEDFKNSMVEMVEAHGLKDWESLENLLSCYLRVNKKSNHGYIVGAFVDLLVGLPFGPKSAPEAEVVSESNCSCSSSPLSFYTSFSSSSSSEDSSSTPCVSSSEVYREAVGDEVETDAEEISTPCAVTSFDCESERRK